ncbi:MAG: hypothetical protein H0W48_04645 [Methylibium sp.]|nr:hypothetical protein [Methylibium sp.]
MPKWSGTIYEVLSAPISPLEIAVGSSRRSPSWAAASTRSTCCRRTGYRLKA